MNAERTKVLGDILLGTNEEVEIYSFAKAVSDLDRYEFAGSLLGALQAIQVDAGAKQAKHDEEIRKIVLLPKATKEMQRGKERLTDAIKALKDPGDLEKVRTALRILHPKQDPPGVFQQALTLLQGDVREARLPEEIQRVEKAFRDAGITIPE
ncbi:MAG: hypothetical protein FJ290_16130 [Planctomycetes bacterium]|nr:hypothetical protein [Planctomycetota bacterium]